MLDINPFCLSDHSDDEPCGCESTILSADGATHVSNDLEHSLDGLFPQIESPERIHAILDEISEMGGSIMNL